MKLLMWQYIKELIEKFQRIPSITVKTELNSRALLPAVEFSMFFSQINLIYKKFFGKLQTLFIYSA
mgnify:CR=1 FL=1